MESREPQESLGETKTKRPSKGGAPKGNKNRMLHGMYSLSLGTGPKDTGYIQRLCYAFRRYLEEAVVELRQEVAISDAATIQTCIRWERHALLAQRWIRTEEKLTIEQKISISREIATASDKRDQCIKALGLNAHRSRNVWEALRDATPQDAPDVDECPKGGPGVTQTASNAT
jgi:hypothetical protein